MQRGALSENGKVSTRDDSSNSLPRESSVADNESCLSLADGLHVGGGITEENAQEWIDAGAEKVSAFDRV